jgi:NAD+ diphosphatase
MQYERQRTNLFAGPYLERNAWERDAEAWLEIARADASTRFVLARGTAHLVAPAPAPRVMFLPPEDPRVCAAREDDAVLLGWFDGVRCVLIESAPDQGDDSAGRFEELRPMSPLLPEREAGLLAYARALGIWRARHRYCGACGTAMRPRRAGHVLACSNPTCAQEVFPRIDPAIIVLVTDGDRALLGRQASWPPGRFSTIAGFVEPGESLEDAVAREVYEETGVRVGAVSYHSSQPWPFPSSLMLGFHAAATAPEITRRDRELEDAQWFTRADIAAGRPMISPPTAISYRLIEAWFDAGWSQPLADVEAALGAARRAR